jgi:hypothetical protein
MIGVARADQITDGPDTLRAGDERADESAMHRR